MTMQAEITLTRRRAPVWLMGLSNATFGLVAGFIVVPLPQMLAAQGVNEARISAISAACLSPGFWVFLLGPVLDFRFSRRWYASVFAAIAGIGVMVAVLLRAHLLALEIALMLAYTSAVLSSNALGGWLACVLPQAAAEDRDDQNHERARLSAWTQVGNFIGNGLMAGLVGEALRTLPLAVAAFLLGALVVLPAAVFPWIPIPITGEPDLPIAVASKPLTDSFNQLLREVITLLRRREVLLTLLLFIAPTGAFALTNQLSGIGADFHASEAFVSRMGGIVLTLAGAASCLLLPVFARWVKPLPLYLLIGTAGSLFTLAMLLLPHNPATFAIAFLAENVVQALSFTAAVAICFATIGSNNPLAATQFSLLTSATVLPILYMGVIDGRVYASVAGAGRIPAMYAVDGGLSLAACALMAVILWRQPTRIAE
jgi:PAT family beta-lactamase induction signal transducer AmpG